MFDGKEMLRQAPAVREFNGTFWNVNSGYRICKSLKAWCRGPGSHRSHRVFLSFRRGVMPGRTPFTKSLWAGYSSA